MKKKIPNSKPQIPKNVKCNCGHTVKDHWHGGWCHSSGHPKAGQCGCTFFYPNDRYILRKQKEKEKQASVNHTKS